MTNASIRIRAVLFDVGGPLDTEVVSESLFDRHIIEALAAEGIAVTDAEFTAANARAVEHFSPSAYQAIIWTLTGGDVERAERAYAAAEARAMERDIARGGIELRPGVAASLGRLHARGLLLGLAANQPATALDHLDALGIGRYFTHREVSGTHGLRKPDPRLFLRACADLGVEPEECAMVGDRIDNDIAPAKALGMRAVLFRTGRHIDQQPRSWTELPDREVHSVEELERALDELIEGVQ